MLRFAMVHLSVTISTRMEMEKHLEIIKKHQTQSLLRGGGDRADEVWEVGTKDISAEQFLAQYVNH